MLPFYISFSFLFLRLCSFMAFEMIFIFSYFCLFNIYLRYHHFHKSFFDSHLETGNLFSFSNLYNILTRFMWWYKFHFRMCMLCCFCDPMDCSLPVSPIHGILQARVLEWAAIPSSRRSSNPGRLFRKHQISTTWFAVPSRQNKCPVVLLLMVPNIYHRLNKYCWLNEWKFLSHTLWYIEKFSRSKQLH